jgi:peptidyl-tRNA hydrolase, PTH1 family
MKLIVALGNPGKKYEHTRHNAGWLALDFYLKNVKTIACQSKFSAEICELHEGSQKIFFVKPKTYMNESGSAVREICDFYKLNFSQDLLVLHDDSDLPLSTIRTTPSSSSAGHNGVKNIIEKLGTQDFHRIRIGVETRESDSDIPTDAFVLQNFKEDELKKLEADVFPKVKDEIEKFLTS